MIASPKASSPLKLLSILLFFVVLPTAVFSMGSKLKFLSENVSIERDLPQDYLMGRALRAKINPYQPIANLSKIFFPEIEYCSQITVSPHTPFLTSIFKYLSYLDLKTLNVLWFILSIFCLFASIYTLTPNIRTSALYFLMFILSEPVKWDLFFGQLSTIILLLLSAGYVSFKAEKKLFSGIFFGVCFALKFSSGLILLYLLLKRELTLIIGSLIAITFCCIFTLLHFDIINLQAYFYHVLPQAFLTWITNVGSISFISAFYRVGYPPIYEFTHGTCVPSLIPILPTASYKLAVNIASFTLIALSLSRNLTKTFNLNTFANLLILSLLAIPISWQHYWILLIPKVIELDPLNLTYQRARKNYLQLLILIVLFYFNIFDTLYTFEGTIADSKFAVPTINIVFSSMITILIYYLSADWFNAGSKKTKTFNRRT